MTFMLGKFQQFSERRTCSMMSRGMFGYLICLGHYKQIGSMPNQFDAVHHAGAVRRLTPLECERLQGFPDNWTAGQSDTQRYRQMGNAVAVPVAEWVARNIAKAT